MINEVGYVFLGISISILILILRSPRPHANRANKLTPISTDMTKPTIPAFKASRLTPSTFLIIEHSDVYSEHPFIYAKIIPSANTIVIIDTGCGGATNDETINLKSLREFIETVGIEDNEGDKPLNEGGKMRYIVVLSHCHYDHICRSLCIPVHARRNNLMLVLLNSGSRTICQRLDDHRILIRP